MARLYLCCFGGGGGTTSGSAPALEAVDVASVIQEKISVVARFSKVLCKNARDVKDSL
jgi:hypothetical protein